MQRIRKMYKKGSPDMPSRSIGLILQFRGMGNNSQYGRKAESKEIKKSHSNPPQESRHSNRQLP